VGERGVSIFISPFLGQKNILRNTETWKKLKTKHTHLWKQTKTIIYRQCCGSGMCYPGSWFLHIPDPGSKNSNKREVKKICYAFLCSNKFQKIAHYFSFEVLKIKICANFQRIIELFTQKIAVLLIRMRDPVPFWPLDPE
jgi:hypothetical protein